MPQYLNTVGDGRWSIATINFLASETFFPLLRRCFCHCNLIFFTFFFLNIELEITAWFIKKKKLASNQSHLFNCEAHERHLKHDSNKEQGTICQCHLAIGEA